MGREARMKIRKPVNFEMARSTLLYTVQSVQPQLGAKTVYIPKDQHLFSDGVCTTSKGETVCFFFVSRRNDLTLPKTSKQKTLHVASVGVEYAKMWVGTACSSLFGALTGIGPGMEIASLGVNAAAGGMDGVGGVMGEAQKGWEKDARYALRGTEHATDLAAEQDFVVGGCASFKWVEDEVKIKVKMWDRAWHHQERISAKENYIKKMVEVCEANQVNEIGRADNTYEISHTSGQSLTVRSDDFIQVSGQN